MRLQHLVDCPSREAVESYLQKQGWMIYARGLHGDSEWRQWVSPTDERRTSGCLALLVDESEAQFVGRVLEAIQAISSYEFRTEYEVYQDICMDHV